MNITMLSDLQWRFNDFQTQVTLLIRENLKLKLNSDLPFSAPIKFQASKEKNESQWHLFKCILFPIWNKLLWKWERKGSKIFKTTPLTFPATFYPRYWYRILCLRYSFVLIFRHLYKCSTWTTTQLTDSTSFQPASHTRYIYSWYTFVWQLRSILRMRRRENTKIKLCNLCFNVSVFLLAFFFLWLRQFCRQSHFSSTKGVNSGENEFGLLSAKSDSCSLCHVISK